MTKQLTEIRTIVCSIEVRESQDAGMVLEGYPILYGVSTTIGNWFTEEIQQNAFSDSITKDDVRALFNHDSNLVLGRTKAETLFLSEDAKGVKCEIHLPNTSTGRNVYELVQRGDISQMSFAFWVEDEEWSSKTGEMDHRVVKRGRLKDVSPVTFPAYEETEISARAVVEARNAVISGQEAAAKNEQARVRHAHRKRELELLEKEI